MQPTASGTTRPSLLERCRDPRVSTALATLIACAVLLPLLGHRALTDWDEGIYAEISREMLHRNPLVPHWNYQPWFEKPPLMLWLTALFFKLFGVSEFWARAASAFSGVAIVALLHATLLRAKDRLAAWLSTFMLLATFGFLHICRVGEMDVLLSLGCTLAITGLVAVERRTLTGWYLFWLGFAIAAMTKGAACIVLILALLILLAIERTLRSLSKPFWLGLVLCALLLLPWHLMMFHLYGRAFLDDYLGFHVLARATRQIEDHRSHWWYYLNVLLVSAAPFVLVYPFAIVHGMRRHALRPWAIFALVVIVFFSIVQTRLPHYIAPAYPALTLLTAVFVADKIRHYQRVHSPVSRIFWIASATAAVFLCIISAPITSHARSNLRQATVGPDTVAAQKESVLLLRRVFRNPPPAPGPLLTWWEGNRRSIATSVFYAQRPVQQVQPFTPSLPFAPVTDKYMYRPEPFASALNQGPRLLLLDRSLVPLLPADLSYEPIATGRWMEVGLVQKREFGHP